VLAESGEQVQQPEEGSIDSTKQMQKALTWGEKRYPHRSAKMVGRKILIPFNPRIVTIVQNFQSENIKKKKKGGGMRAHFKCRVCKIKRGEQNAYRAAGVIGPVGRRQNFQRRMGWRGLDNARTNYAVNFQFNRTKRKERQLRNL